MARAAAAEEKRRREDLETTYNSTVAREVAKAIAIATRAIATAAAEDQSTPKKRAVNRGDNGRASGEGAAADDGSVLGMRGTNREAVAEEEEEESIDAAGAVADSHSKQGVWAESPCKPRVGSRAAALPYEEVPVTPHKEKRELSAVERSGGGGGGDGGDGNNGDDEERPEVTRRVGKGTEGVVDRERRTHAVSIYLRSRRVTGHEEDDDVEGREEETGSQRSAWSFSSDNKTRTLRKEQRTRGWANEGVGGSGLQGVLELFCLPTAGARNGETNMFCLP